jgi:hypothetical protein
MVCNWWDDTCFWQVKNWQPLHRCMIESTSDMIVRLKNPCQYVLPMSDFAPAWLPQTPACTSCKMICPSSRVMHFIRVPLAPHRYSSSLTSVYCPTRQHNHSHSTLSSVKPPVLRYNMKGVRQSEWISMTSGDSVMLSSGGRVSWDDSATLLALAKAFHIVGSWSSCKKTPVGTIAWLEPSLAISSTIPFFPRKICMYLRPSKLFSNLWSSW